MAIRVSKHEFNFTPVCQMDLDLFHSFTSHNFAAIINEGCIDFSMNLFYYCPFVHNSWAELYCYIRWLSKTLMSWRHKAIGYQSFIHSRKSESGGRHAGVFTIQGESTVSWPSCCGTYKILLSRCLQCWGQNGYIQYLIIKEEVLNYVVFRKRKLHFNMNLRHV